MYYPVSMAMMDLFLDKEVMLIFGCLLSAMPWNEYYNDPMSVAVLTTLWLKCVYIWLDTYFLPVQIWYFAKLPFAESFNQITTTSLYLFVWACLQMSSTYVVWYFLLLIYYRLRKWNAYFITRNKIKDTIEIKFVNCGCRFTFWDQSVKLAAMKQAAGDWSNLDWGYDFIPGTCTASYMEKLHALKTLTSIMFDFSRRCEDDPEESDEVWADCVCCPACAESPKQQPSQTSTLKPYCVCCPACSGSHQLQQSSQNSSQEPSGAKQKKISNHITAKFIKNKKQHFKSVSNLTFLENKNNKSVHINDKKLNINVTKPVNVLKSCNDSKKISANNLTKVKKQLLVNNKNFSQKSLDLKFSEDAPYPYFFEAGVDERKNSPLRNRINILQAWLAEAPCPGGGSLRQSFFTFHVLQSLVNLAESQTKLRPHFDTPHHTKQLRSMSRKLTQIHGKLSELGGLESKKWIMMKSIWIYLRDWRSKLGGKPFKQNIISFPSSSWAKSALLLYVRGTQLDKLTCLLALGPARQRCAWCDSVEKQPGSLHLCYKCVTSDFPNISVTCSRTCARRWWKFEHWAEHLEHSLGLYIPKPLAQT